RRAALARERFRGNDQGGADPGAAMLREHRELGELRVFRPGVVRIAARCAGENRGKAGHLALPLRHQHAARVAEIFAGGANAALTWTRHAAKIPPLSGPAPARIPWLRSSAG